MNAKGEVRTAWGFKQEYLDSEKLPGPFRCPFCEVPLVGMCIINLCKRAPHFALRGKAQHRNGCTGDVGPAKASGGTKVVAKAKRKVEGEVDTPEALVLRRAPVRLKLSGADMTSAVPDSQEVLRRRRVLAGNEVLSSRYTVSSLRTLIAAYEALRELANRQARAAGLVPRTGEYNARFRAVLKARPLALYSQQLDYGDAFMSSRLSPWRDVARIYEGAGRVSLTDDFVFLKDVATWPEKPKSDARVPFVVRVGRRLPAQAPTSHRSQLERLEAVGSMSQSLAWWAFGTPRLTPDGFVLDVESLDHLYSIDTDGC